MSLLSVSWWRVFLWLISSGLYLEPVESHHILGLFVNVHRSQLLVHLAVCRALLQKGHHLTLVTTLPLDIPQFDGNNVTHVLIPWQQQANQEDTHRHSSDLISRLERMFRRLEDSQELLKLPEWKSFLHKTPAHFDILLLGYHFNDHLLGVAAHFKCPVAIITTQQPTGFVNSLMGNPEERWYVPQPYDSRQRSGIRAWLFGVWEKLMEVMARRVLEKIYSSQFPEAHYPSFESMRRSVALALNNHHAISEGPIAPVLPNMVDIGGIVLEQTIEKCIDCLGNRSIILFSLGTRFTWRKSDPHLVSTFTSALSQFPDYDIYWTYDGPNASKIQQDSSHLRVAKWWPQSQLLASGRVRLFITHGGKGSLSEALYFGVPMLGLPLMGDQRANLQKMQANRWGLSLSPRNLSYLELSKTMKKILSNPEYAKHVKKSSQLYRDRPIKSSELATYWIQYIIRHRGAKHAHNPARQLSFIEYHSIDVYLAIYGGSVLAIITLRKLNRLL
ncbi:hypothetical protein KR018_006511 [Drosophila ironensis]|nr:hypothetical protein KR018_006511 [Drosophila ironensis]